MSTTTSERETKEFTTKSKSHTVKAVTYLTRRERREIKNALFGDKEINVGGSGDINTTMSMAATDQAEDKTIELAIVELDGNSEDILGRYLELPDTEADEIKQFIDRLTATDDSEKKA